LYYRPKREKEKIYYERGKEGTILTVIAGAWCRLSKDDIDISAFLGPEMALASLVAISGPKKVSIFRAQPLPMALEMDFPPSKSLRPYKTTGTFIIKT
jgi:hypothetical protein